MIETLSTIAAFSIILLGVLFIDTGKEDTSFLSEFTFYLLMLVNVIFLVRWIYLFFMFYFSKIQKKLLKSESDNKEEREKARNDMN